VRRLTASLLCAPSLVTLSSVVPPSQTASYSTARALRPPVTRADAPATAGPVQPLPIGDMQESPNWSGYGASGGPFTAITGTFTVPGFSAGARCTSELSEWVGIDGMNVPSSSPDPSLVQAGASEFATDTRTGICAARHPYIYFWWEIVPAPPTAIKAMRGHVGDKVTVTIARAAAPRWLISITDDSDKQHFATERPYQGVAATGEWIVEAPTSSVRCGAGLDPWVVVGLCPLLPFQPAIAFTALGLRGKAAELWPIAMVQESQQVATPSLPFADFFGVMYTGPDG